MKNGQTESRLIGIGVKNRKVNFYENNISLLKPHPLTPSPNGEGELPLLLERVGVRFDN
jgi:hypothetical protein